MKKQLLGVKSIEGPMEKPTETSTWVLTFPFMASRASLASSTLMYLTKPKPRDLPVSLSLITSTEWKKTKTFNFCL